MGESPERGGDEEDQGEPFSDYYPYAPNAMALVDSAWVPASDSVFGGTVTLRVTGTMPMRADAQNLFIIETVSDESSAPVFRMSGPVMEPYKGTPEWTAQWTHLKEPVREATGASLWSVVEDLVGPHPQPLHANGTDFELRLVSFPEEHSQTTIGTGWVFLIRELGKLHQPSRKDSKSGNPARRAAWRGPATVHLIRSGRIGPTDMAARLGSSSPLSSKRVLLLGAGAVGSVIADQLTRSGVLGLTVIDYDVLEPGNLVRHASNLNFVGTYKSGAAATLALQVNPYLEVQALSFPIGSTAVPTEQRTLLAREYERADLILDATAEIGVQRLSASLARQARKPWIGAWATNGAIGGAVIHIPATAPWCFSCFEWTRQDNLDLLPPASPAPLTQPIGCAEPTFIGPAYNLNEVSLHAVRTAAAALTGRPTHDAAIFSFAQYNGGAELPQWNPATIEPHQKCTHR